MGPLDRDDEGPLGDLARKLAAALRGERRPPTDLDLLRFDCARRTEELRGIAVGQEVHAITGPCEDPTLRRRHWFAAAAVVVEGTQWPYGGPAVTALVEALLAVARGETDAAVAALAAASGLPPDEWRKQVRAEWEASP